MNSPNMLSTVMFRTFNLERAAMFYGGETLLFCNQRRESWSNQPLNILQPTSLPGLFRSSSRLQIWDAKGVSIVYIIMELVAFALSGIFRSRIDEPNFLDSARPISSLFPVPRMRALHFPTNQCMTFGWNYHQLRPLLIQMRFSRKTTETF